MVINPNSTNFKMKLSLAMRQEVTTTINSDKVVIKHEAEAEQIRVKMATAATALRREHLKLFWGMVSNCGNISLYNNSLKQVKAANRKRQMEYLTAYRREFKRYVNQINRLTIRLIACERMAASRRTLLRSKYRRLIEAMLIRDTSRVTGGLPNQKLDCQPVIRETTKAN